MIFCDALDANEWFARSRVDSVRNARGPSLERKFRAAGEINHCHRGRLSVEIHATESKDTGLAVSTALESHHDVAAFPPDAGSVRGQNFILSAQGYFLVEQFRE